MVLRLLVLLLLLLNGVYFAWSQQMLRAYGFGPDLQSEPQHLEQQIEPQRLIILPADAQPRSDALTPCSGRALECQQAGLADAA